MKEARSIFGQFCKFLKLWIVDVKINRSRDAGQKMQGTAALIGDADDTVEQGPVSRLQITETEWSVFQTGKKICCPA